MTYRPVSPLKSLAANLALVGTLFGASFAYAEKPSSTPELQGLHVSDILELHMGSRLVDASQSGAQLQNATYASKIMAMQTELEHAFASQIAVEQENEMLREMLLNLSNELKALQTAQGIKAPGHNDAF